MRAFLTNNPLPELPGEVVISTQQISVKKSSGILTDLEADEKSFGSLNALLEDFPEVWKERRNFTISNL